MDAKLKHLEFLQAIISRMANNSFLIKGWAITLISAIYALAAKESDIRYVMISFITIPCFWILDGFFIAVERRYRKLYVEASNADPAHVDFNLDSSQFDYGDATWLRGIFSQTLLVFYPFLIVVALIVMFAIKKA